MSDVVNKLMRKYTLKEMRAICQKYKIPYVGMKKKFVAENMVAYKRKQPFLHVPKIKLIEEVREEDHKITPVIRAFCFSYAMSIKSRTYKYWARKYSVSEATVYRWLQWKEVNDLVETFQLDREARINHLYETYEIEAFESLLKIVKSGEDDDVKLKAINDFLGYAGRVNRNRAGTKVVLSQQQKQGQMQVASSSPFAELTDDALDAEINELDNLLLEEHKEKID